MILFSSMYLFEFLYFLQKICYICTYVTCYTSIEKNMKNKEIKITFPFKHRKRSPNSKVLRSPGHLVEKQILVPLVWGEAKVPHR